MSAASSLDCGKAAARPGSAGRRRRKACPETNVTGLAQCNGLSAYLLRRSRPPKASAVLPCVRSTPADGGEAAALGRYAGFGATVDSHVLASNRPGITIKTM